MSICSFLTVNNVKLFNMLKSIKIWELLYKQIKTAVTDLFKSNIKGNPTCSGGLSRRQLLQGLSSDWSLKKLSTNWNAEEVEAERYRKPSPYRAMDLVTLPTSSDLSGAQEPENHLRRQAEEYCWEAVPVSSRKYMSAEVVVEYRKLHSCDR